MAVDSLNRIESWLVEAGLAGASETESLHGFFDRCRDASIAPARATVLVDTLHPIHEGRVFRWRASRGRSSRSISITMRANVC